MQCKAFGSFCYLLSEKNRLISGDFGRKAQKRTKILNLSVAFGLFMLQWLKQSGGCRFRCRIYLQKMGDIMQKILVVVDMQKDFIDGALGSAHAAAVLPAVKQKAASFSGRVIFTRDTHEKDYLTTQEGRLLPVEHCIRDTDGWQIDPELFGCCEGTVIDKPAFGSVELGRLLSDINAKEGIESITLVGLCTDICVISNAMLIKAFLPEIPVIVDAKCCAGVTAQSHETALAAMRGCQITVENA